MFTYNKSNGKKVKVYSTRFMYAIGEDEFEEVIDEYKLSDKDLTVIRDGYKNNLLHVAAKLGNPYVCEYLLAEEVPINAQNASGNTPLLLALQKNDIKARLLVARELLNASSPEKVDVTIKNKRGHGPLHFCRYFDSDPYIVKKICDSMTKMGFTNEQLANAILEADCPSNMSVYSENIEVVKLVYAQRGNVNEVDEQGRGALHAAIYIEHLDILKYLLQNGANPKIITKDGLSLFHWIISGYWPNNHEVMELLVQNGTDVNARAEATGKTILHMAAECISLKIAKFFVDHNADVLAKDFDGNSVLHFAARSPITSIMKLFLSIANLDINEKNLKGETPLLIASKRYNGNIIEFLLDRRVDVNAEDDDGNTALLSLLDCYDESLIVGIIRKLVENERLAQLLLDHGTDINKQTSKGKTILTEYISKDETCLVHLSLRHIAKLESMDIPMSEVYSKMIDDDERLYVYYTACKYELQKMKELMLFEDISLFTILACSFDALVNYVNNEELVKSFNDINLRVESRLYRYTLLNKFESCVKKRKMLLSVSNLLMIIFSINNSDVIEKIVSYLHADDLKSWYVVAIERTHSSSATNAAK